MTRTKRLLFLLAVAAALAGVGASTAGATNECRGLMVCVSVPGPWVAIPAAGAPPVASYELKCPGRGRVVGGLDALVTHARVGVTFDARLGSPVNPGISTTDAALFTGVYSAEARRATAFRPFLGCIPTSGGGGRGTTARRQQPPQPPGLPLQEPTERRVWNVPLASGTRGSAPFSCPRGRLVSASTSIAFWQTPPPNAHELASVSARIVVRDGRAILTAVHNADSRAERVEVQVVAVCTRP
jgi:hypothetical protein